MASRTSPDLHQVRDQQRNTWNRFSAGWQKWDDLVGEWLRPYGSAMINQANLQEDFQVLDVAAGTGEPGLTAAGLVPRGRVVITDLSEEMLAVATRNATRKGLDNVEIQTCEAGALPFADATFDAVLCRFGFMFFPDMAAAAVESIRVATPGARVCAAVWGDPADNPWAAMIMTSIARHLPVAAPVPGSPGLFRCAAPGFLSAVFAQAGLHDIAEENVSSDLVHESPERYWEFMNDVAAPVVAGLAPADVATRDRIRTEVLGLAGEFRSDGAIRIPSTATVVVGTR